MHGLRCMLVGLAWCWSALAVPVRLCDVQGQPVAGATVRMVPEGDGAPTDAVTRGDGTFDLRWPLSGVVGCHLLARVPGRGCLAAFLPPGEPPVDLSLEPGTAQEIAVYDDRGEPVAGASVHLTALVTPDWTCTVSLTDPMGWAARSAPTGVARIENLPRGLLAKLMVSAPGLALASVTLAAGLQPQPAACVDMVRAGVAHGRILLPGGQGAAGLTIAFGDHRVVTASTGRYELRNAADDWDELKLLGEAGSRWLVDAFVLLHATPGATVAIKDAPLVPAGRASGQVASARGGDRVPWHDISMRPAGARSGWQTRTDHAGRFDTMLRVGTYEFAPAGGPAVTVTIAQGQTVGDLALVTESDPRVCIMVRDDQARPLANARLGMARWRRHEPAQWVRTDERGTLYFPAEHPEDRTDGVYLWQDSPARAGRCRLLHNGRPVAVVLSAVPLCTVAGRVVDVAGHAVAGGRVMLQPLAPADFGCRVPVGEPRTAVADEAGAFHFDGVPKPWRVRLSVAADGADGGLATCVASSAEAGDLRLVVPSRLRALSGQVVDAAGRAVAGALVYAEDDLPATQTVTDSDGRFSLPSLPSLPTRVVAQAGRRAVAVAAVGGEDRPLRLVLAELPATDWRDAPTPADRELARDLLRPGVAAGDLRSLRLMLKVEPRAAVARLMTADRRTALRALFALPPDVVLGEEAVDLAKSISPEDRAEVAWLAAAAVPDGKQQVIGQLLAIAADVHPTGGHSAQISRGFAVAALAERARAPRAAADREAFVAACRAAPSRLAAVEHLLCYSPVPEQLLRALLGDKPGSAAWLAEPVPDMPDLSYATLQALALHGLAPREPAVALALARRWCRVRQGRLELPDIGYPYDPSPVEPWLVPHMAEAEAVSQCVGDRHGRLARRLALAAGDAAARERWLARIDDGLSERLQPDCADALLALALLDPARAETRRRQLLSNPAVISPTQRLRHTAEAFPWYAAHGLSLLDPNRARWSMDALYARQQADGEPIMDMARGMAVIDLQRAVTIATRLDGSVAARCDLARWLLANRTERCISFGYVSDR